MDPRVAKLVKMGLDEQVAEDLVDNDLGSPRAIKAASDNDLIEAVGSDNVAAVRALFPEPQA